MRNPFIKKINLAFLLFLLVHFSFAQFQKTLIIEGNHIWIREFPKTGKVVFTLNEGSVCNVLEKGEEQIIRGSKDFWYKIEYKGKTGWVFGSQSSIKQKASLDNFEPFLKYFLNECFWGQNMDSLIYYKSVVTNKFIHPEIGYTRFYNPGAVCYPQDYNFYDDAGGRYYGTTYPVVKGLKFYAQQEPRDGFCEASSSPDGIYYQKIETLPGYPDIYGDGETLEIDIPAKYKYSQKIIVHILSESWIIKTMYFMVADDKWWLVVIDDCDCSA